VALPSSSIMMFIDYSISSKCQEFTYNIRLYRRERERGMNIGKNNRERIERKEEVISIPAYPSTQFRRASKRL